MEQKRSMSAQSGVLAFSILCASANLPRPYPSSTYPCCKLRNSFQRQAHALAYDIVRRRRRSSYVEHANHRRTPLASASSPEPQNEDDDDILNAPHTAIHAKPDSTTGDEPEWMFRLRAVSESMLARHGLGVHSMKWGGGNLSIYVSTLDDLADAPGAEGASIDDCQLCSRLFEDLLDTPEYDPGIPYTLQVSTPGTSDVIARDREFEAFQGFTVTVRTSETYKKKTIFEGTLKERTEADVCLNMKGRILKIPRGIVQEVRLAKPKTE